MSGCTYRVRSAPTKGQISSDYDREFPLVEVGPRQLLKRTRSKPSNLGSVQMDSEVKGTDSSPYDVLKDSRQLGNKLGRVSLS